MSRSDESSAYRALLQRQESLARLLAEQRRHNDDLRAAVRSLTRSNPASRITGSDEVDLTRRRVLEVLGGLGAGSALGLSSLRLARRRTDPRSQMASPPSQPATLLSTRVNPLIVPPPTGVASTDTANILSVLHAATAGSTVVFQWSASAVYSIDQELVVRPGVRVTGMGASSEANSAVTAGEYMPTLQQAAGVSLVCILGSFSFLAGLYGPNNPGKYSQYNSLYNNGTPKPSVDSGIEIDHLAFDGQNGGTGSGNTAGHGVVIFTYGAKLHDCFVVNTPYHGIWMADGNWAGTGSTNENHENRIYSNTVINPGWSGIKVDNDYGGSGGSTDGHILGNIVASPSKQLATAGPNFRTGKIAWEGIRMENAAGWWMVDNHLIACPGDGFYLNTTGGIHLVDNVVDGFGCCPLPNQVYTGYNVTTAGQTKLHPGRIIGNLAAAYETTNPFGASPPTNTTYRYFTLVMQTNPGRLVQPTYFAYPTHADNVAYQASGPPPPIGSATIPKSALNRVDVPSGAAAKVVVGLGVTDSAGVIPAGTTVTAVVPGTSGANDSIHLSKPANGPAAADTVSFIGPTTVAWTYINTLAAANMIVQRTNEVTTGTISPVPVISIRATPGQPTPTVTLVDPANFAGGVAVTGTPTAGEVLVATATGAQWQNPPTTGTAGGPAGGVLSGDYPNPALASLVSTFTKSAKWNVPQWVTTVRVTCVGGGGGGGGGTQGGNGQVGGGGGAAGASTTTLLPVTGGTALTVSVGAGGAGGNAGASGAGGDGAAGSPTRVSVGGVTIAAAGGPGGQGAQPGTGFVGGGLYGGSTYGPSPWGAGGGRSGTAGGSPIAYSPGGGGGGGAATGTVGGSGGSGGRSDGPGAAGATGQAAAATGGDGTAGQSPGAGGGGGGAGAHAAGGAGGAGAAGLVVIEIVR